MSSPVVAGVLVAVFALCAPSAHAQGESRSATVAVSLTVLPQASFEGGGEHPLAADLIPGQPMRVDPSAGVRTRMTYNAAAQVRVSGGPLVGPGGATVQVRFVCAFGGGMTVSAAEPFDCVDGLVAEVGGARSSSMPLAIGAELSARDTRDTKPGLYRGRVILTATYPTY